MKGTPEGWTLTAGGTAGAKPRFGDVIAEGLSDEAAIELVGRIINFTERGEAKKVRLGRIIEQMGVAEFRRAIGVD